MLQKFLFSAVFILMSSILFPQLILIETGINYIINFEESHEGVNEGAYSAAGIVDLAQEGQLNSKAWEIKGCSDGDALFESNSLSADFTRGNSLGYESIGGLYNFETISQNHSLGWQSTSSDLSPGSITLKIQNLSGFAIERLSLSYRLFMNNDQNRSQSISFHYSYDNLSYTSSPLNWASPAGEDPSPIWKDSLFTLDLDLLAIADEGCFYLKWKIEDNGGSGSRDEWALDDIAVEINNNTCLNEIFSIDTSLALKTTSGFSLIGIDSYYTSPSNYGLHSPSARMDDEFDQLLSPILANPFSMKFWLKALGNSSGSSLLIEGFDGSSWIQLDSISPLPGSGTNYSISNIAAYIQFRFTYLKENGNLAIDDIRISCGTCQIAEDVLDTISSLNFTSLLCNQAELSWSANNSDYYLVLASEKSSISTSPQDQYSYYANSNYGNGEQIEDSVFVVYNGSADHFSLQQLESGKTYLIKVIPYNGLTCEENYADNSISAALTLADCSLCPYLEWALINPCNEDCGNEEGKNEVLLFNSGEYAFSADTSVIKIFTDSNSLLNQEMIANPVLLNFLNSSCSAIFIDASEESEIPAGASILLCNNEICLSEIPVDILCLYPTIYLLVCQSTEWNLLGTLKNQGYIDQSIRIDLSGVETNCVLDYHYTPNDLPNEDGVVAHFETDGGSMNDFEVVYNCDGGSNPLPIDWGILQAHELNSEVELKWFTYSEIQNLGFEIEHSSSGDHFSVIAWIESKGESAFRQDYSFTDTAIKEDDNFYRVKQIDANGNISYSNTVWIKIKLDPRIWIKERSLIIEGIDLGHHYLSIHSITGQIVYRTEIRNSEKLKLALTELKSGMYILNLNSKDNSYTKKFYWKN